MNYRLTSSTHTLVRQCCEAQCTSLFSPQKSQKQDLLQLACYIVLLVILQATGSSKERLHRANGRLCLSSDGTSIRLEAG